MDQLATMGKAGETVPAMEDLEQILHCLKSMPEPPKEISVWVKELHCLISKILRSPPNRLDDTYRKTSFELIRELFTLFGCRWLEGDQQLLSLIAHLVTAQLRILLDNPTKIDSEQLTACCSIEEECIRSIEDEEAFDLDEATATTMSITCREAVVFVTDYWGQSKESEEELPVEVECVMYRLVCVFLSIGGAEIMKKDDLKKICPHLIRICWTAVEKEDFEVARQLICVLHELPFLDSTVLNMLTSFVKIATDDKTEALNLVESIVDILKDRADWYDKESLQNAVKFAKEAQYTDLSHFLAMVYMIVLSDVYLPTEGVRLSQPQVEAFFDTQSAGEGTLCVSESSVTWISRQSQKGISLSYKSIILHATSSDLSSFPREHIYVLVDCSKAERPKRAVPLFTAEEARHIQNLNMQEEEMNGEEADDADSEDAPSVQIRFVPIDTSCLQQIYDAMAECQELNPEEDDMSDEEEDLEAAGDIMPAGQWYTADNLGDNFELSEEGMANLQRMMGGGGDQQNNGHHNGAEDENMDDS